MNLGIIINIVVGYDDLLIVIGIFLSICLTIVFGIKTRQHLSNLWLSLFFVVSSAVFIVKFLYSTGQIMYHPHWFKVNFPTGLLRPLFIYLFLVFLLEKTKKVTLAHLLHFMPFLILLSYLIPFYLQSETYKVSVLRGEVINTIGVMPPWYLYFQFIYSGLYLVLSIFVLRKHASNITRPKSGLGWIYLVPIIGCLYLMIAFILRNLGITGSYNYYLYEMFAVLLVVIVVRLMYLQSFEKKWFQEKYEKSKLSAEDIDKLFSEISILMRDEDLFKKKNLRLIDISNRLKRPEYQISQIINARAISFNDFVNTFRIEEAKKLLIESYPKFTIEGIANESGFHSRASFYKSFKKLTNQTPREFVHQVK
ncbi:helix-turn-helix domain-containing protein [Ekhidna sp.]|uniref:helix-turn-helix domain-containing protein n=1 Tax=Ekhidna sp. TaxID=2608089 RepID=UPI003BA9E48F